MEEVVVCGVGMSEVDSRGEVADWDVFVPNERMLLVGIVVVVSRSAKLTVRPVLSSAVPGIEACWLPVFVPMLRCMLLAPVCLIGEGLGSGYDRLGVAGLLAALKLPVE